MTEKIKTYVDKEMCAECKGECCKESGCMYMPSDFKSFLFPKLKKKLLEGDFL